MADISSIVIDLPQAPPKKASQYLHAYTKWAYDAIKIQAQSFGGLDIKLYQKQRNGDIEEIAEHPVLSLLQSVNSFMTYNMLKQLWVIHMNLLGEAAWLFLRNSRNEIIEIWPLRPDWIEVRSGKSEFISHYVYRPYNGAKTINIAREDLILFKDPSPTSLYRGYGRIQANAFPLDIDDFSDEANRNYFFNGAFPGLILSMQSRLSEEGKKRLAETWQKTFGGKANAHKVAIIDGAEVKVDKVSDTSREMDYIESKKFIRDQILSGFGVSTANLGITESSNRAVQEATDIRLMKHVILPQAVSFIGFLNEFLIPQFDQTGTLFFNCENPIPEDVESAIKEIDSGITHYWMSINEARERRGLDPVEGGDVILTPTSVVPLGTNGQPVPMPPEQGVEPEQGEEVEQEETNGILAWFKKTFINKGPKVIKVPRRKRAHKFIAPIPTKSLASWHDDALKKDISNKLVEIVNVMMNEKAAGEGKTENIYPRYTKANREQIWDQFIKRTALEEATLAVKIEELARQQQEVVLNNLQTRKKHFKSAFLRQKLTANDFNFPQAEQDQLWRDALQPLVARFVRDHGMEALGALGAGNNFDMAAQSVRKYVIETGLLFVRDVNTTTRKALTQIINQGIRNGDSIDVISKAIREEYDKFPKYRSKTIARTTVIGSSNFASEEAWIQSEAVEGKVWITAKDEKVRHSHAAAEGQIVPLNKPFNVGGHLLQNPGDPLGPGSEIINCRCTQAPILKGVKEVTAIEQKARQVTIDQAFNTLTQAVLAQYKQHVEAKDKQEKVMNKEQITTNELERLTTETAAKIAAERKKNEELKHHQRLGTFKKTLFKLIGKK